MTRNQYFKGKRNFVHQQEDLVESLKDIQRWIYTDEDTQVPSTNITQIFYYISNKVLVL